MRERIRVMDTEVTRVQRHPADFLALTRPRVVVMVLVTTLVGFYLASVGAPDYVRLVHTLIGVALAAGGTLALNQYLERDVDARMKRTRLRPLPDGRLQPIEALGFGVAITGVGLLYLAFSVNVLSAFLTSISVGSYLFLYTPLKRKTSLCSVVGAVPGALPPVIGWGAARGELGLEAWVLFGILFLWQIPHSLAIARLYRDDYARAGIRVLPVVEPVLSTGRAEPSPSPRSHRQGCTIWRTFSFLPAMSIPTQRASLTTARCTQIRFMPTIPTRSTR